MIQVLKHFSVPTVFPGQQTSNCCVLFQLCSVPAALCSSCCQRGALWDRAPSIPTDDADVFLTCQARIVEHKHNCRREHPPHPPVNVSCPERRCFHQWDWDRCCGVGYHKRVTPVTTSVVVAGCFQTSCLSCHGYLLCCRGYSSFVLFSPDLSVSQLCYIIFGSVCRLTALKCFFLKNLSTQVSLVPIRRFTGAVATLLIFCE